MKNQLSSEALKEFRGNLELLHEQVSYYFENYSSNTKAYRAFKKIAKTLLDSFGIDIYGLTSASQHPTSVFYYLNELTTLTTNESIYQCCDKLASEMMAVEDARLEF